MIGEHPALVCVVCGNQHHPDDCDRARRFVAECRRSTRTISDRPVPVRQARFTNRRIHLIES